MERSILVALLLAVLLPLGCAGQLLTNDDDDAGDDDAADDDAADDDAGDDDAGDDDAGDDDAGDDDAGDDDAGDDDAGDDDAGDDDAGPQVQCGPYQPPGGEGRVFSGEGELEIVNDWWWQGCEVERRFGPGGVLDCELLWSVEGGYYAWDPMSWTARYELFFEADHAQSTCPIGPDEEQQTWYYRTQFDWDHDEMDIWFSESEWDNGTFWSTAHVVDNGSVAPFSYVTGVLQ